MPQPSRGPEIDLTQATDIVRRYLHPSLTVVGTRKLCGGSINRVVEWRLDGPNVGPGYGLDDPDRQPRAIVAKLNHARNGQHFQRELASLRVYRDRTRLPVPTPIACLDDDPAFEGSGILMERIDGVNLSDARVSPQGFKDMQGELARHVVALHAHRRATFGSALEPAGPRRWLDVFQPIFAKEFAQVREAFGSKVRWVIDDLLQRLEHWLPEQATPTLVHGDLWANNILVHDGHPDQPEIRAFIDASASYCDPECELAYLQLFNTADDAFFETYRRRHPIRPGFSRRCRVYWLNTMLMHVRVFGDKYVPRTEQLVAELKTLDH